MPLKRFAIDRWTAWLRSSESTAGAWRDVLLLTLAGFAARCFFLPSPGHILDLQTFGQWALALADNPWNRAYEVSDANYPPGALFIFELIGRAYRALVISDPDHSKLRIALKLPSVLFDLGGALAIYAIARRFVSHPRALLGMALFACNPAVMYDSSIWGMNDSITSVSALAAVGCLLSGWRTTAWIVLGFAVLNKPPVLVLAPLFVLEAFVTTDCAPWRQRALSLGLDILTMLAFGWLIALPFYTDHSFLGVYHRMFSWYVIGSSLYPYTSANAFNVHALYADFFKPDTALWLLLPIKIWADGAFIIVTALISWQYCRLRDDRALLEGCFLIMLTFFLVLTEMHERYLVYALTFVPVLAALDRAYLWSALLLTLTQWLNLEYSLTYMWLNGDNPPGVNPKEFAPVLARLCAMTNIGVWIAGVQCYASRESTARISKANCDAGR